MNEMAREGVSVPSNAGWRRPVRIIVRVLLLAWAALWAFFNIASAIGEASGWQGHVAILVVVVGVTVAAWLWPRVGGLVLAAIGVAAAVFFANPWAQGLLALPAIVIGAALFAVSIGDRR